MRTEDRRAADVGRPVALLLLRLRAHALVLAHALGLVALVGLGLALGALDDGLLPGRPERLDFLLRLLGPLGLEIRIDLDLRERLLLGLLAGLLAHLLVHLGPVLFDDRGPRGGLEP